ncbi:PAS domain-containing sensor histidine kinase [Hyphobacterium sp. CCMP332]|nr:PAS domain-containing sensor histidine kinase [Hyphobacterium sp. CCMP332]
MESSRIFDALSDVVVICDKYSKIIEVSPSIEDIFLYKREEVIGEDLNILIPQRFHKGHQKMFKSYTQNPVSRRMGTGRKLFAIDKNGDEFSIDISLSSAVENGQMMFIAIIRDISDIIQIQRKLEEANLELVSRNKELDQFAHIVSHDLKSPINNITALINLIKSDHLENIGKEGRELFKLVEKSSLRMNGLIEAVLSYSRAGHSQIEKSKYNLQDLIAEVVENLQIKESFEIINRVENLDLHSNRTQMFQVLSNLIGNAIKYHDKKKGRVVLSSKTTIDEIEISVKDDGPGIEEKYHNTLFNIFSKAHSSSRKDSSGIGLAIVKKLVKQNNGTIKVISAPGRGSEFIFTWKK